MRILNYFIKKNITHSALITMFFLSSIATVSFADNFYSYDITEKVVVKEKASLEAIEPAIEISEPNIATASGIDKIEDGYPIEGRIAANSLRLRSWPWGAVVGKYTKGDKLQVLGESGEFYLVEIDGKQGYMHKSYITTEKKEASFEAPSYPGNTRSGGYIALKDGVSSSNEVSNPKDNSNSGSSKYNSGSNNNSGNTNNPGVVDNTSSADYTGVTKVIYDIVKKFCDANEKYELCEGHSKTSGYVKKSDCSGFTGQFINKLSELAGVPPVIGDEFPTSTEYAKSQYTQKVTSSFPPPCPRDLIKPGDVFVMKKSSPEGHGHVGIFMGYNDAGQPLIAHSTTREVNESTTLGKLGTTGVRIEVIPSWYTKRWMGVYRLNNMDKIISNLES